MSLTIATTIKQSSTCRDRGINLYANIRKATAVVMSVIPSTLTAMHACAVLLIMVEDSDDYTQINKEINSSI